MEPYTGDFGGAQRNDDYVITVNHPNSDKPRSFVGLMANVTWEFEQRVCYYVGNGQGGEISEVAKPNDPVIQGEYSEYKVGSLFSAGFMYSNFDDARCI